MQIPVWFIPSFHGDIRITAIGNRCSLHTTKLTQQEREALAKFSKNALKKKWVETEIPTTADEMEIPIDAPIEKVSKTLARLLKPGRTVISAVKFSNGTMEEIRERSDESPNPPTSAIASTDSAKPTAAASVAAPTRGCPPPDFPSAEIRARDVLRAFLSPDQIADFNKHNRFISIGATTGNRYMITSRLAGDQLATFTRTLYDLDRKTPLCVHDWDVPPAEEMLSLHLLLQLPGWERYLRVTEDNMEEALREHMGTRQDLITIHDKFSDEVAS